MTYLLYCINTINTFLPTPSIPKDPTSIGVPTPTNSSALPMQIRERSYLSRNVTNAKLLFNHTRSTKIQGPEMAEDYAKQRKSTFNKVRRKHTDNDGKIGSRPDTSKSKVPVPSNKGPP
ncbi:uncharacterized protein LOC125501294 isoform X2 [Athalia rosae]|uniref:uncharacterized protein LOC125501294 isoform X2 n=1 Tax=Athalia rosae TaxID=37344 RepID=UPI0020345C96|nr:uncharacterized protein LOC125501294 isoform X2 [Athalia rosae]